MFGGGGDFRLDLDVPAMTQSLQPLANRYAELMGQVQLRWTSVLSPVVFIAHHKKDLLPVFQYQQTSAFGRLMEQPQFSQALAKVVPAGEFTKFLTNHIDTTAASGLQQLEMSIFDSALVFGHSILDDVLNQCLAMGRELRPRFFREKVFQKKISIQDLTAAGAETAIENTINKWLSEQDRSSIVQKFDLLLALTEPEAPANIIEGFWYDRAKVVEIDELRHSLVHRTKLRAVGYADLDYFRLATNFALGLLSEIGVDVSLQHLLNGLGINFQLPPEAVG